jgi:hypothetical protein
MYPFLEEPVFKKISLLLLMLSIALSACGTLEVSLDRTPTPSQQPPVIRLTETPVLLPPITETPILLPPTIPVLPSSTPDRLQIVFPKPGTVVLDFVENACNARWGNGGKYLPCPGNRDDLTEGYIMADDHAMAEGMIPVAAPVLIGLPGMGNEHGAGLFGIYPPITIQAGDTFHAVVACQDQSACDVTFALTYIDANGKYQDVNWWWKHHSGDGPTPVQVDLSPLAGQTVKLILAVPIQNSEIPYHWVLWIYPYVARASK